MFNLPAPKTAAGRAIERAIIVAVVAGLGVLLNSGAVAAGGAFYFVLKTLLDVLNANVPTL